MKFITNKIIKIILISTLSYLSCIWLISIKTQVLTPSQEITVDISQVIAEVANNPVGLNLNFLLDNENIITPVKELKLGSFRYPMGEIADYYLFDRNHPTKPKISIRDSSLWFSSFINADGTWKNSLNFDEFVNICRSVNAEPFVVIGIDALTYTGKSPHATPEEVLQSAVDLVAYANVTKRYNIKHWEIGNENDLPNAYLNWTAEKYAETVVQFTQAMKQIDPSIKIGVNGMTGSAWWDKVMPIVKDNIDFLVTHQYSSMQSYEQWNSNNWNYTSNLEAANQAIDKYNPKLRLNVTENSSFNPSISHANNIWKMLHNFEMLSNIICFDKVDYFHFWISQWFTNNPYLIDASVFNKDYKLLPIGYPLKILGIYLKKQMVYSTKQVEKIRSWASYDPDNRSLNLFLLNKNLKSQLVTIQLNNYVKNIKNSDRLIISGAFPDSNKVDLKHVSPLKINKKNIETTLTPLSITVISLITTNIGN